MENFAIIGATIWGDNMKVRIGFVTNSSSSSFLIAKKYLDEDQIKAIREHEALGKSLGMWDSWSYVWDINENEDFISGYTFMDNFSMYNFFEKIGISNRFIKWGEHRFDIYDYNYALDEEKESEESQTWRDILHNL